MSTELEKNYFELFDLPMQFDIDLADLANRYRALQRQFHPDRYANHSETEKRFASQMAAQINAAYRTLKSPLERGRYLLSLTGVDVQDEKDTSMAAEFLVKQMELHEALEEIPNREDPYAALLALTTEVNTARQARIEKLGDLFLQQNNSSLTQAYEVLREIQFLEKFLRTAEQKEDELA